MNMGRTEIIRYVRELIEKQKACAAAGHVNPIDIKYIVTSRSNPLRDMGISYCSSCGMLYERHLTENEINEIRDFQNSIWMYRTASVL
jgi:hypothetical protein